MANVNLNIYLPLMFRSSLNLPLEERGFDVCILTAINNVAGQAMYDPLHDLLAKEKNEKNVIYRFRQFCHYRGFRLSELAWLPYLRYNRQYNLTLHTGYKFTTEELALSLWSLSVFNFLLCLRSPASHVLLRLDRSPLGSEYDLVSHTVSARFNN